MKNHIVIFSVLLLAGCVSADGLSTGGFPSAGSASAKITKEQLTNINSVYTGMTMSEVEKIMGHELVIGYEFAEGGAQTVKNVTVPSPYHSQYLDVKGKKYFVAYYLTQVKKADGMVSDDELTPLVFQNDILAGKGHDFLYKLKNP